MTDVEVQESLIRWLNTLTGLTVIKSRQGINRPEKPYLMVEQVSVTELSRDAEQDRFSELDTLNSEGLNEISVTPLFELEWTMFVFAYGEGQSSTLRRVKSAEKLNQHLESLHPLTIHETGVVNAVPEFVNNKWEDRFQMNVRVRGVADDEFTIDTIEEHTPFTVEVS